MRPNVVGFLEGTLLTGLHDDGHLSRGMGSIAGLPQARILGGIIQQAHKSAQATLTDSWLVSEKCRSLSPEELDSRIANHPVTRIAELLPWNLVATAQQASAVTA